MSVESDFDSRLLDILLELYNCGFIYGELAKGLGDHPDSERAKAAINDLELLPGITLREVVELKDKLVVLDDDQATPAHYYAGTGRRKNSSTMMTEMLDAGFRRVSPLGEKEGS